MEAPKRLSKKFMTLSHFMWRQQVSRDVSRCHHMTSAGVIWRQHVSCDVILSVQYYPVTSYHWQQLFLETYAPVMSCDVIRRQMTSSSEDSIVLWRHKTCSAVLRLPSAPEMSCDVTTHHVMSPGVRWHHPVRTVLSCDVTRPAAPSCDSPTPLRCGISSGFSPIT